MSRSELAVVYATLILNDDGVEVSVRWRAACRVLNWAPGRTAGTFEGVV